MIDIHPTAVISEGAQIGPSAVVGPYCVIGPDVSVGDGTRLMSHVVMDGHTTIGKNCTVFPFACIGKQTQDLKFKGDKTFVEIGDETTIREYVTVNSGTNEGETTRVGSNCHIMAYSHVAHACTVGDRVIMANCATLAGEVDVEADAILGGLVAVHQFCRVGRMCIIGGCTKITQDAPPFMTVDGHPAAVRGLNLVGLKRKGFDAKALKLLKEAYRCLYRSDLSTSSAVEKIKAEVESSAEIEHLLSFVSASQRGIIK
ncbi:MAG: acyl-ACP--UDP-N-acetylglucosamine O-acyltransferase [Kiritimatiellia bacterium]|jgi:UDP-N-acetylglucosamine acyltransferase|nr:acyl-ACP--UDP-N-acetylglucosamine O-acyltransferase [Kiritimatiellia bacterium]